MPPATGTPVATLLRLAGSTAPMHVTPLLFATGLPPATGTPVFVLRTHGVSQAHPARTLQAGTSSPQQIAYGNSQFTPTIHPTPLRERMVSLVPYRGATALLVTRGWARKGGLA